MRAYFVGQNILGAHPHKLNNKQPRLYRDELTN